MLGRHKGGGDYRHARAYVELALPAGHSLRRTLRRMNAEELNQLALRLSDLHAALSESCGQRLPHSQFQRDPRPDWVRRHDINKAIQELARPTQGPADLLGFEFAVLERLATAQPVRLFSAGQP